MNCFDRHCPVKKIGRDDAGAGGFRERRIIFVPLQNNLMSIEHNDSFVLYRWKIIKIYF